MMLRRRQLHNELTPQQEEELAAKAKRKYARGKIDSGWHVSTQRVIGRSIRAKVRWDVC